MMHHIEHGGDGLQVAHTALLGSGARAGRVKGRYSMKSHVWKCLHGNTARLGMLQSVSIVYMS
eukprot:1157935-Pelagomonas_calceolata.AAC.3